MENSLLSTEIRQYFTRRGNSYRFHNGMSLNQLAIAMEIEPSSLSRVISGERLFTADQARAFCDLLHLDDRACWKLRDVLATDLCERAGLEKRLSLDPRIIDMLVIDAARVEEAAESGALLLALTLLQDLYSAYTVIDDDEYPTAPMVRILSLAERQREKLLATLEREGKLQEIGEAEIEWEIMDVDHAIQIAESMPATLLEQRLWHKRYLEEMDVDDIARTENLTVETVYAILQRWTERLFHRLAES